MDDPGPSNKSDDDKKTSKNSAEEENEAESNCSDDSDFAEFSWRPMSGEVSIVSDFISSGVGPRDILPRLLPNVPLPEGTDDASLWHLIIQLLTEPPKREKLAAFNTYSDAIELIRKSNKILVLTGAGISVSCGIPDFRSKDGIYSRLHKDFPDLPNPQAMFDIQFFKKNPLPFYSFAKEIYPGKFEPSFSHKFIAELEKQGKLLRNYTQNIDTLEQIAGIQRVVQCHGSFATASCCTCNYKVNCDDIREDIENSVVPKCPQCPPESEFPVVKPDIVFFGEGLPKEFHDQLSADKEEVDLLIVIGSSLKVRPVALIPNSISGDIPQILINNEPLPHLNFDIELLGSCDEITRDICARLAEPWNTILTSSVAPLEEILLSSQKMETVDISNDEPSNKKPKTEDSEATAQLEETTAEKLKEEKERSVKKTEDDAKDESFGSEESGGSSSIASGSECEILIPDLPPNSYFFIKPKRSVFSGAKIFQEQIELKEKANSSTAVEAEAPPAQPVE